MPTPTSPLMRNSGSAWPPSPAPNAKDHPPSISVALLKRQKFASVPPIMLADRWPQTPEIANKIVDNNAANTPGQ